MKAKKENKAYMINTDQEKQRYLKEGYDIYNEDGTVLEYSPQKKVTFSKYMEAVKEIESLQKLVAERNTENEALKAEVVALQKVKSEPAKKAESKKAGE
ncbi:MAG: hypothetical protein MSA90_18570 [Faecalicatena sp.]|uniref:hypothetical protein n=1 Tax=Faecalicatena sp. TaxID=2005360 RepID=UPI00258A4CC1|nr:hypothetical protein [Faecalicatena sp.]MCI6467454.1 hypothetical protein [Faecalicatena sp.]MDY5618154.1 hypothetical protein [Lachnospiraceae bacterium]